MVGTGDLGGWSVGCGDDTGFEADREAALSARAASASPRAVWSLTRLSGQCGCADHAAGSVCGRRTELAAARAAQTPEQVRFVVAVAIHDAAVREHDLCADEAIAGQPVLAPEQTDPAAKGEAGDADGGTAPAGRVRP